MLSARWTNHSNIDSSVTWLLARPCFDWYPGIPWQPKGLCVLLEARQQFTLAWSLPTLSCETLRQIIIDKAKKKQEIGLALARDSEIDEPKKGLSFRFRLHPWNSPAFHLVPRLYTTEVKASPPNLANYKLIFDTSKSCVGIFLHFNKKCIFSITFSPFLLAFQICGIGPCVETSFNLSYAITGVCKWSLSKCRPHVIPAEQFLGVELPSRSMG